MNYMQATHGYNFGSDDTTNYLGGGTEDEGGANFVDDGGSYHAYPTDGDDSPEALTLPIDDDPFGPIGELSASGLLFGGTADFEIETDMRTQSTLNGHSQDNLDPNLDPALFQTPNSMNSVRIKYEHVSTQSDISFSGTGESYTPSRSPVPTDGAVGGSSLSPHEFPVFPGMQSLPEFTPRDSLPNHEAGGAGDANVASLAIPQQAQEPWENEMQVDDYHVDVPGEIVPFGEEDPVGALRFPGGDQSFYDQRWFYQTAGQTGVEGSGVGSTIVMQSIQGLSEIAIPVPSNAFDIPEDTVLDGEQGPTFACDFQDCDRTFDQQGKLRKHQAYHKLLLKCKQCNVCCADERDLKRHVNKHQRSETWHCRYGNCVKSFTRKDNTLRHVETHHGITGTARRAHVWCHRTQATATENTQS